MKKSLFLTTALASCLMLSAENRAVIFIDGMPVSQTKVKNIEKLSLSKGTITQTSESVRNFEMRQVDSLCFYNDTVRITYNATGVVVDNPLQELGLSIAIEGSNVKVTEDTTRFDMKDVVFVLNGATENGSFVMNQLKRVTLQLNNLTMTSTTGVAIGMLGDKSVTLELVGNNAITDASVRDIATDSTNACFYVNDKMDVNGTGNLAVSGTHKNGIYVKDDLAINSGNITSTAMSAAIRVKDNFVVNGGTVTATSANKDCIEANDSVIIRGGEVTINVTAQDSKGITCDAGYFQSGGRVGIMVGKNADGSKGLKVGSEETEELITPSNIEITGGELKVTLTDTKKYTNGTDESSPAGLKSDGNITISGGVVEVTATEGSSAVKGLSADKTITVKGTSKVTVDIESATGKAWCFKAQNNVINLNCVKATINEDNSKYEDDDSGIYKPNPVLTSE